MGQATEELLIPFLGALQASIAVLLTIFVGVIASQFQLIGVDSSKEISKVAVRLFLPALLIVNVGSQLHSDTVCTCHSITNSHSRPHQDLPEQPPIHLKLMTSTPGLPLHPNRHLVHLLPTRIPSNRRSSNQTLQSPKMGNSSFRLQQHHQPSSPPSPIPRCSRHSLRSRLFLRRRRPREIILPRQRHDFKLPHLRSRPQIPRLPR